MAAPQKVDVYLEGLSGFQDGAAALKVGDSLCLQQQEGGQLVCATQGGAVVGSLPAAKRGLLSRGPWSGTVRSVKRKAAELAADPGGSEPAGLTTIAAETGAASAAAPVLAVTVPPAAAMPAPSSSAAAAAEGDHAQQQEVAPAQPPAADMECEGPAAGLPVGEQAAAAAAEGVVSTAPTVVQLLVRFIAGEQRWQQQAQSQQQPAEGLPPQQLDDESTARLTTEQFEQLGAFLHAAAATAEAGAVLPDGLV